MERRRLGRGDQQRRRSRPAAVRNLHLAAGAETFGDAPDGGEDLRDSPGREVAPGDGDAQACDAGAEMRRERIALVRVRRRIARVGPLDRVERGGGVLQRRGEHADMIEAPGERRDAGPRDPPVGRLEPVYAAERRRYPHRAVGVRAERERHQPGGDGGARTARRAAGDALGIARVAHRPVMRVLAGEAVGELVHVGQADEDRAGRLQPRDSRRVLRGGRGVGADPRSRAGRAPGDIEQVLGCEGPAGERSRR